MLIENALQQLQCIHADLVSAWIDAYINDINCQSFEEDMDKAHLYKFIVSKDCTIPECVVQKISTFITNYRYSRLDIGCEGTTNLSSECVITFVSEPTQASCTLFITTTPIL